MGLQRERVRKRKRRHLRVRRKVVGTSERPRLCVFRSLKHIYAQIIDDTTGSTLAAASSLKIARENAGGEVAGKISQARAVGRVLADVAKEKGVTKVRFDRGGYIYHGRIAALAEAAREGGLEF